MAGGGPNRKAGVKQDWPATPKDTRVVVIDWFDIMEYPEWNDGVGECTPLTVSSVGWLLEERPQSITIASTFNYEESQWSGIHVFPTAPPEIREVTPPRRGKQP